MRISARMVRRSFAIVGMIALAFAYLPAVVAALNASPLPACCAGMLCPMHMAGGHMMCGMDMTGTAFQVCPCHSAQYTVGIVFNRVDPPLATSERPTGMAPALRLSVFPSLEPEVLSPPPRTITS